MKNIMIALLLLVAGSVLTARQIALYDQNAEWTKVLADILSTPNDNVRVLERDALVQKDVLLTADLLVIPNPQCLPVTAAPAIQAFVNARKSILFLGPRPFSMPQYPFGNEWLTTAQQAEKRLYVPAQPLVLPPEKDWNRSMRDKTIPVTFTVEGTNALHYSLTHLVGWTTFGMTCQNLFPAGHDLLCCSLKGSAGVRTLSIEFKENDGSRWIATPRVTTSWQRVTLTAEDFRFWTDCKPTKPRDGKGDKLNFAEARYMSVGLADSHNFNNDVDHLEFSIKDLGTAANPYRLNSDSALQFPYLETFYPAYKQFPVPGKPGLFSTLNRFQGRGYKQESSWRYRPLKIADGRLIDETDCHAVSPLWLMHYLDGPLAGTRIATYAAPVDIQDARYLQAVRLLAARLGQPLELVAGGTCFFGMFPDQTDTVGVELERFGDLPNTEIIVETTVAPKNGGAAEFVRRTRVVFAQGTSWQDEGEWQPKQADCEYLVTVRLLVGGKELDRLTQEVYVSIPREQLRANTSGFITVKGSNFMLDGKPWYPVGVNFKPSNTAGTEYEKFVKGFLVPGFYDTEQIEKDLTTMESAGINMISASLLGNPKTENTLRNLIDFFHRCRRHNIHVNGYLGPGSPFNFNYERARHVLVDGELRHFPELFAYDICWEPGNYTFRAQRRPAYNARWNAWLKDRYGSIDNALKDWNCEPNRRPDGSIDSPTDAQMKTDGPWRVYVAAYRRFMDDVTSQLWNQATRQLRTLAPRQLFSFRQGNTLPQDFVLTGPVKHLDFICPEGYCIPHSENGYNSAGFITRFAHFTTGGKPVIWAEFGLSIWDAEVVDISVPSMQQCTAYHDMIYRMALDSGANGTVPWYWSGWYRVEERSDFGISGPDGVPRPMANLIKTYGPRLQTPREYPEGDMPFLFDRDSHPGGYWYVSFNTGRDAYKQARAQQRHLKIYTPATGKTSADVPLVAIGNVPCNGSNPPKYLNAEFNAVVLTFPDGSRREIANGATIDFPHDAPVIASVSVGNLGEAAWKASGGQSVRTGDVVLECAERTFTLQSDIARFQDAQWDGLELASASAEPRVITLRLNAANRSHFGEIFRFTLK